MRTRYLLAGLVAAIGLTGSGWIGLSAAPVAATESVSVALDWYPNSDHAGLYTAIRRGLFARRGLDVYAYVPSDSSAQLRLVAAGRADFGISYETDLLAARAQHVPVRSVMCIMQHPLNTVMTLRSSGIARPRQLAGRTIGMAGSPSDQPIISAMMRADGSSIARARVVNVGYKLLPVLLAKRVDAVVGVYWTWEAIQARERGYPVNAMRVEQWGVPNYCELVLVTHEHTIQRHPALVRAVVQAMQAGYAYAESHPHAAWQALASADASLSHEESLIEGSVGLLRPVVTGAPTIGEQNTAQWRQYAAWLWHNKLIAHPVTASDAFTNSFLSPSIK